MTTAIFDTHGYDSKLNCRSGSTVAALRPLTEKEADLVETGPMFRIRFDDGYETDAFEDELYLTDIRRTVSRPTQNMKTPKSAIKS